MDSTRITAKGIDDKLLLKIPPAEWSLMKDAIKEYVLQNSNFLLGARVILDFGDAHLRSTELFEIRDLLMDHQVVVVQVYSESATTRQAAELLGIKTQSALRPLQPVERETDTSLPGEAGLVVIKTLRSGNVVNSEGHITIIGDVNPGATLRAAGSIVIWGKMRGEAHAGMNMDVGNVILALEMAPTSLSIAGISLSDVKRKPAKSPEQAFISKDTIKISPWKI
jgi:septum site-determining protein MinC